MASMCLSQTNFQQHQQHLQLQQFHFINDHMLLLQTQQPQQHQQQQQQQQSLSTHFNNKQQLRNGSPASSNTKILGTSYLQNILPAPTTAASVAPAVLPKKKYTYANMPYGEQLPSVARRNARERNRVKQVNNGFANLRQHLPQSVINALSSGGRGASKKLSKVDTLRVAVEYIRGLQDLLDESDENRMSSSPGEAVFVIADASNDGYSSIDSPPLDAQYPTQLSQSYKSEASASPAPSYTDSDISIGGVHYLKPLNLEGVQTHQDQQDQQQQQHQLQFKFEAFSNYDQLAGDEQPDDEELLDYISSWQEQ